MFGLFKKKSEIDKLNEKYQKLMEESFRLSTSNRTQSDQKAQEANEVLKQIESLQK
ncbi:MAG: Lacal_2735 family protein [Balneolaceae bacterium]